MANEADPTDELTDRSPKFHVDRSSYGAALETWMAEKMPAVSQVSVSDIDIPTATGFSNETVFFDASWIEGGEARRERFVARIDPQDGGLFPVQTPACKVSVGLQHRIMATVAAHSDVPITPLLDYEPDPTVLGQPFFVMRFVDGVIPADAPRYTESGFVKEEASPEQRHRMVRTGLGAMARIHAIDWKQAGLDWLDASGTRNPTQAKQIEIYRRYCVDELRGRDHPVMMTCLDWLEENDPGDDRIGVSWGDSRLANIIWQDYEPAAVVDWEACALSPTEADVGWWLMFDRMSFEDLGMPRMEGYPTREEQIELYQEASGREVRHPHYWEVFGAMRFAAIFIRLGDRMVASGLVPEEMNPAIPNPVTAAVARLLDIENPTPPPG